MYSTQQTARPTCAPSRFRCRRSVISTAHASRQRLGAQRHNQSPKKKWAIRPLVRSPNWGQPTQTRGPRQTRLSPVRVEPHSSGLSRNQLQLLYNTPKTRKKQRFYALKRCLLPIARACEPVYFLSVRGQSLVRRLFKQAPRLTLANLSFPLGQSDQRLHGA